MTTTMRHSYILVQVRRGEAMTGTAIYVVHTVTFSTMMPSIQTTRRTRRTRMETRTQAKVIPMLPAAINDLIEAICTSAYGCVSGGRGRMNGAYSRARTNWARSGTTYFVAFRVARRAQYRRAVHAAET